MKASGVLYFFRGARRERVNSGEVFPNDHFYGVQDWSCEKNHAEFVDQADLPIKMRRIWWVTFFQSTCFALFRLKLDHIVWFGQPGNLEYLNRFRSIVVVTLSQGLALSYLKRRGKLQADVYYILTGKS